MTRSAFIAIIGKPNVGKSSILNRLTGSKIAIVSSKPQTTRTKIMGVLTRDEVQLVFTDTPGFHHAHNKLGEHMNQAVGDTVGGVDACLFVVEPKGELNDKEQELLAAVDRLMETTSLYTDAGLTVAQVAVALGRPHRNLSAAISHGRQTTFKAYVNGYRVNKAFQLIGEGWLAHHTIDALGAECGFSNRVHFYRIFKQAMGVSPSEYASDGNNTNKM